MLPTSLNLMAVGTGRGYGVTAIKLRTQAPTSGIQFPRHQAEINPD